MNKDNSWRNVIISLLLYAIIIFISNDNLTLDNANWYIWLGYITGMFTKWN